MDKHKNSYKGEDRYSLRDYLQGNAMAPVSFEVYPVERKWTTPREELILSRIVESNISPPVMHLGMLMTVCDGRALRLSDTSFNRDFTYSDNVAK